MRGVRLAVLWCAILGCSGGGTERAALTVVSVEPQAVPPDVRTVDVLYRATRSGSVQVVSDDAPGQPRVLVDDAPAYAAGTLGSVGIPTADMIPGPHLVSVVLRPTSGAREVSDQAVFYIGHEEAPPDGGVDPGDGGTDPDCVETCQDEPENPVCGTDDHTYENACLATCAGTNVGSTGECHGQFTCFEQCVDETPIPVCGVDDTTYLNQCNIDCEGVEKAHDGPCFDF